MSAIFAFAEWLSILKLISTSSTPLALYLIHHSWKVEPQMYASMEATKAAPIELWSVEETRRAGKMSL